MLSPGFIALSARVDLPTPWTISEMAPRLVSASAIVSGIRSPSSSSRTMTNCPGCRFRAMCGASTQNRTTSGASVSLLRIRCTAASPLEKAAVCSDNSEQIVTDSAGALQVRIPCETRNPNGGARGRGSGAGRQVRLDSIDKVHLRAHDSQSPNAVRSELSGWQSRARASGGDHEEQESWLTG